MVTHLFESQGIQSSCQWDLIGLGPFHQGLHRREIAPSTSRATRPTHSRDTDRRWRVLEGRAGRPLMTTGLLCRIDRPCPNDECPRCIFDHGGYHYRTLRIEPISALYSGWGLVFSTSSLLDVSALTLPGCKIFCFEFHSDGVLGVD